MKRAGFTLIELLVVVAIIGILSSILLPSLSKAREKGQQAVCISNQKQIASANVMYAESSVLPDHWDNPGHWEGVFEPFLGDKKNNEVYMCPSQKFQNLPNTLISHYTYNPVAKGKSISQVTNTDFAVTADGHSKPEHVATTKRSYTGFWQFNNATVLNGSPEAIIDTSGLTRIPDYRHSDKAVMSFIDGHVKTITPSNLVNKFYHINN